MESITLEQSAVTAIYPHLCLKIRTWMACHVTVPLCDASWKKCGWKRRMARQSPAPTIARTIATTASFLSAAHEARHHTFEGRLALQYRLPLLLRLPPGR